MGFMGNFMIEFMCLQEYEWGLAQYLGAGVAACYRGTRVYDTPETRDMVKKWVSFYKVFHYISTFITFRHNVIQAYLTMGFFNPGSFPLFLNGGLSWS